jgi:nucleoside-diphosphate-sugar epimerase
MKPLHIALTGGRGRLAPFVAAHLSSSQAEVVTFSRKAGDGFQCTSLLSEPGALAAFDVILHLAWSTVPFTSEEMPGVEGITDLPLLQELLDSCVSSPRPPLLVFFSSMGTRRLRLGRTRHAGRSGITREPSFKPRISSALRAAAVRGCAVAHFESQTFLVRRCS